MRLQQCYSRAFMRGLYALYFYFLFLFLPFFHRVLCSSTRVEQKSNTLCGLPKNTLCNSCLPFGVRTRLIIFFLWMHIFVCVYYFLYSASYPCSISRPQTNSHICTPWIDSNKNALCTWPQRSVVIIACLLADKPCAHDASY